MPAARLGAIVAFAVAGVVLLVAGPIASVASDWGTQVTLTLMAAGIVALLISRSMHKNR
jgi:hypothetical protein